MTNDVAAFAKQLREDGIEAAQKESEVILSKARAEAEAIISAAKDEAEKLNKQAQEKIAQHKERSEAELKLVARDLINGLRTTIVDTASNLLNGKVSEALQNPTVIKNAIAELLKSLSSGKSQAWEVNISPKTSKALADTITAAFSESQAKITFIKELKKTGFELRDKKGGEVYELTEESLTEAFKSFLSPELKKLV